MIDPAVSRLADRAMTHRRILTQAAAASRPGPGEPGPGQWACRRCGAAWYGTPPEDYLCPAGCLAAT